MRSPGKALLVIGAIVFVLATLGAPAWAQATGGFGAAPAHPNPSDPATRSYFKPVVARGAAANDEVLVSSTSDRPMTLIVSAVDGLTGQTSGAVYANREDPVTKAGTWVKPSIKSVTLAAGGHRLVGFTVTVPASATPGDHLAGIAFENADPISSGSQFGVKEIVRTVVGVDIDVPGPAAPHIHLGTLGLGALPGLHFATLTIHIGDDGRKLVKPLLQITIDGPANYHRVVVRKLDTILPGDTIAYPYVWPDNLAAGAYKVKVVATNGAEREVASATLHLGAKLAGSDVARGVSSASTVPFPLSPAALLSLAFGLLAACLFVGFRFGSRREARPRDVRRALRRSLCVVMIATACAGIGAALSPAVAGAAIANVQTGTEKTSTSGSISPTLPAASTADTLLVAQLANENTSASAPFSGPTGWVNATGVFQSGSGRVEIWYYPNNPGDITSATFTASTGTHIMVAELSEWSDAAFSSPVDKTGTVTATSTTSATASTSAATTLAGDIAFTAFTTSVSPISTFTAGSGWTHVFNDGTRGDVGDEKNNLATGVASETETASTSTSWAGVIVAFKPGCAGGSRTLASPTTITFPATTLNGSNKTASTTGAFTPDDETNSGSGWNLSGTSTTFKTGGRSLATTATQISSAAAAAATNNCTLPANSIGYPVTLPAGTTAPTAVKLYNAAANSGAGPTTVTLTFALTVPANSLSGTYASTWTFSINSGP